MVSEQSLNYLAYERKYVRTGGRRQNYNHTGAVGNFSEGALRLTGPLIAGQIDPVSRSGAICDYVLAEDIANHLDDYKLWIFTDCFSYDDAFLAAVKRLRAGRILCSGFMRPVIITTIPAVWKTCGL